MDFPCLMSNIRAAPKLTKLITASQTLKLQVFARLKHVLTIKRDKHMMPSHDHDHHGDQNRPNPGSLVPVPVYFFAEPLKNQLPLMPYRSFLEKSRGNMVQRKEDCICIVCLNGIEPSHEVRLPLSCSHVFHRECLDVWVDQGHGTCPLCRSKLLATQNHDHQESGDLYRRERMIYLFGEDYLFGDD